MNSSFLLILFLSSWVLTWGLRYYALTHNVIDIPSSRSSHTQPTPRGGGVSIVVTVLIGLIWLSSSQIQLGWIVLASFLVAAVGFLDDHTHVSARWRLLVHFVSSSLVVFSLEGLPSLVFLGFELNLGWFGHFLAVLAIVWLLNLYNFMDGIDGLASIEGISATGVGAFLLLIIGADGWLLELHWLMVASMFGFLIWNFPPAKIFMGDAGSGFLGLMMGVLVLASSHVAPQMLWAWLIMLGVFIVDATYTLFRRLIRGDKIYEAHRIHAYQYASRKYGTHLSVNIGILLINIFWLAPLAILVSFKTIDGFFALLVAYSLLVYLAFIFNAGSLEE
jgi:Fuc2NAc and GlcNAc transferase